MTDDALIEAMAVHMTSHLAVGYRDAKLYALYALAVARPIIEAQERERLAAMFEALPDMNLNAPDIGYIIRNMTAIRETGE